MRSRMARSAGGRPTVKPMSNMRHDTQQPALRRHHQIELAGTGRADERQAQAGEQQTGDAAQEQQHHRFG